MAFRSSRSRFARSSFSFFCFAHSFGSTLTAAFFRADDALTLLACWTFGFGVAASILAFAYGSRKALAARKDRLQAVARYGKPLFGGALVLVGAMILTRLDKAVEAWMLEAMPRWLVELTTRL